MTWKSNPTRLGWTEGQHYITAIFLFKKMDKRNQINTYENQSLKYFELWFMCYTIAYDRWLYVVKYTYSLYVVKRSRFGQGLGQTLEI
jgi:hypothetical protein